MGRIFLVAHHPGLQSALAATILDQSRQTLQVVGASGWDAGALQAIAAAQPDVVVLVLGLEARSEPGFQPQVRACVPGCKLLIVDTLDESDALQRYGWDAPDALLCSERLATELVPALRRLVAQGDAPATDHGNGASARTKR